MKTRSCLFVLICGLFCVTLTQAAVPASIDFQGYARDAGGLPMVGEHILIASLFGDITGGTALWTEADTLTFDGGVFTTKLGDVEPLTLPLFQDPTLFLEVAVDGNISGSRTQLVSVPFAFQAERADSAGFAINAGHASYADSAGNGGGSGDAHWAANGSDIHNTNSGNVGIGMEPDANVRLSVLGGGINWAARFTNGYSDVRLAYPNGSGLWANSTGPGVSGLLDLSSNSISRFLVMSDGKVGIGTSAPAGLLSLNGGYRATGLSNTEGIHFGSNGGSPNMGQLWWGDGTGWKFHMGTRASNGDFAPRFTFLDYGRLGIGTTSPSEALDVAGNIKASGTVSAAGGDGGVSAIELFLRGRNTNLGRVIVDMGTWMEINYGQDFPGGVVMNGPALIHNGVTVNGNFCATGTKNAIVPTSQGMTKVYCDESTEVWFTDRGEGTTRNGTAHINLDPLFLETITVNADHPLRVHVDLYGTDQVPKVVRGTTGFDVVIAGEDAVEFSWRVEAKRKGYENSRLETLEQADQNRR